MTEALRQAHIALTAIFTHPTLELSDFMRDKLTAAIAAAECKHGGRDHFNAAIPAAPTQERAR